MATLNDLFAEYLRLVEPKDSAVSRAVAAQVPLREDRERRGVRPLHRENTSIWFVWARHCDVLH